MNALIPNRFLFAFEFSLHYRPVLPAIDGDLSEWTDADLLPELSEVDGREAFADVWACWNESGLSIACRVEGKRHPPRCDPSRYWTSDVLRLCTDMRDARTLKRATRYCQQFFFLPAGGGPKRTEAVAGVAKIKRAREGEGDQGGSPNAGLSGGQLMVASRVTPTGYQLAGHIPAHGLSGFDPVEHDRIGFYYIVEDRELGQQFLTVGDDLYWYTDPSTWATAVLRRDG